MFAKFTRGGERDLLAHGLLIENKALTVATNFLDKIHMFDNLRTFCQNISTSTSTNDNVHLSPQWKLKVAIAMKSDE